MRRLLLVAFAVASRAQEPATIHVDVNEVTVAVSVSNRDGRPVKNLRRENFTILDSGQRREIQSFWQESDLPLTIGLIVDISGSQYGVIDKHRETVNQFLTQVMGPRDRAFLVTVGNKVRLATDLTGSIDTLRAGVDKVGLNRIAGALFGESCKQSRGCGTPLWDGVYSAAGLKMKTVTGRKALIVLSDGQDVGSLHSLTDAIEAAQSADTLVYTIRYFGRMTQTHPSLRLMVTLSRSMRRLSAETGATAFNSPKDARPVFAEIENDLRNLYVLGFTPPERARDGKFHKLEIKAQKVDGTVRARKGYTAPLSAGIRP